MTSTPEVALNSSAAAAAGKTVPQESGYDRAPARSVSFPGVDFALRLLLFASSVSALVVLVTSKQTEAIPVLLQPQHLIYVTRAAKFNHSPALIYLLVALAVTSLYSIITLMTSAAFISKSVPSMKFLFQLIVLDLLMAGIMISATGSAGSVAYIGLKGNSHVMWNKICNVFDKFCRHIGGSVALSLMASILLVLLVLLSSFTIYRRSY